MDISGIANSAYTGVQTQLQRFDENVNKITSTEAAAGRDTTTQDRALVEQTEIVSSLQANARSLQAASERIGTLLDVKA
ncbi:MAG: hypothetical protein GY744_08745 [Gammaproteobacteria bacterium]|nr:hypothetical protein [Gammaproteobacteria bacterium]